MAIVGSSGSGKSTLMNILGLLDRPTAGRYLLDGQDVADLDVNEQARLRNQKIGFVFQTFHLLPRTSALENVELPLLYSDRDVDRGPRPARPRSRRPRRPHATTARPSCPADSSSGWPSRAPSSTSPTSSSPTSRPGNLDARSAGEIMEIFETLNRDGRTIVLVTHDATVAAALRADRPHRGRPDRGAAAE